MRNITKEILNGNFIFCAVNSKFRETNDVFITTASLIDPSHKAGKIRFSGTLMSMLLKTS